MAHMKFQEYLDRSGKLQTSGKVKTVADYEGDAAFKPVKEKKHKDAGGKGQDGEVKPYQPTSNAKDPNKGKMDDGFANKGDAKLKYNPDNTVPSKVGDGGKKKATWPQTETQSWIEKTKGLSLAEFTKTIREQAKKGLNECACQEAPHNSIKETVSVCKCNKTYVAALVREMKRNGLFNKLVKEMFNHTEAYAALAYLMEDESNARRLVRAMNEMMDAPPMDGAGAPPALPFKKKKKAVPPPDLMGHDDLGGDDLGDDMGDEGDLGDDMDDDDSGLSAPGPDDNMDDLDSDEHGDEMGGEGDDLGMGDEMGGDMPPPPHDKIMPPKPKKKGIHHLLGAMKDHGNLGM